MQKNAVVLSLNFIFSEKKSKKVVAFIEFFFVCNYILDTIINH